MRVKKHWNQDAAPRSVEQMANAIGSTVWKLSANVLLNLENENFETETQAQRLDIIEEIACFQVHVCDRWAYSRTAEDQRAIFISALAADIARLLEDSRVDVQGDGEYRADFIARMNDRCADYARFSYSDADGASFALRCRLGDRVRAVMGARDQRWIPDYIIGREAPEIEAALRRSLDGLVSFAAEAGGDAAHDPRRA